MKVSQKPDGNISDHFPSWLCGEGPEQSLSHPGCDEAEPKVLYSLFQTHPLIASFYLLPGHRWVRPKTHTDAFTVVVAAGSVTPSPTPDSTC